ncbi:hypothetical protein, variant 2 [Aphanomyces astaci]|nr:hypothetical protein, variant 2 [Aphanomyces astaci]ETV86372.1 hypothetical protein, variant 2 [Aphanomyces astaci]|eukprot:XP_009824843.1 hypothetical protein, variant 2 [Aphanomyces astaci]
MLLWCLDEYMYYSLLTLGMLVLFECTLVKQRQQNMGLLRQMRRPPVRMLVYRQKTWIEIQSRSLVPGDICSIGRPKPIHRGQDMSEHVIPCDMLVLHGGCVVNEAMLSGESIPLRKEMLDVSQYDADTVFNMDENVATVKKHILYGGTKVLQFTAANSAIHASSIPDPPDKGCIAFVLRTGFGTTQGNLMRTILFSAQRVTANNMESMLFILCLLCFALVASGMVLHQGLQDPTRNTFKLFLHCVMIITSVVPPELPMELSLAVTNSLLSLSKRNIFCTEPFRIPFAGKVDVVCFDKTGTLTSDALEMHGVAGLLATSVVPLDNPVQLVAPTALPTSVQLILAGCHSLMVVDGKVLGDPLETTILSHVKWNLRPGDVLVPHWSFSPGPKSMKIVHRYAFSSELKRMSSIVVVEAPTTSSTGMSSASSSVKLLSKGAPEVMESLFETIPHYYTKVYTHYAMKGCRVLALGSKSLSTRDLQRFKTIARSKMETDLVFGGFVVLDCPLKPDTADVILHLNKSNHKLVMITGDNALTACDVATQIQLTAAHPRTLVLQRTLPSSSTLAWVDLLTPPRVQEASPPPIAFTSETVASLAISATLCVPGDVLSILTLSQLQVVACHARVFARTSPAQKEMIVDALNQSGLITAMCGDGTNDVGALKRAHVGISIINTPDDDHRPSPSSSSPHPHVVKFGDASIASPFTSKQPSIHATAQILCQGRCTLVTTVQMYKILGINCLISAYVLSSLYMHGVKQGDAQMTVVGVVIALFFLFLSYATPLDRLSARRPLTRVFCASVLVSISGQFAVHLMTLAAALHVVALPYVDLDDPAMHPEAKFRPNVLNSIVFVVSLHMQINTFVANYHGAPFMQSFAQNRLLARWTYLAYSLVFVAVWEIFPPLNVMLELVFLPSFEVQATLTLILLLDTAAVLGFETVVQWLTARYPALMA